MKTKLIAATVVALATLSGMSAFAQSYEGSFPVQVSSSTTRAQVQADYLQARKEGTFSQVGETGKYTAIVKAPSISTVTRAEVRAQAVQAAKTHQNHNDPLLSN